MASRPGAKAGTIDEYLAALSNDKRAALEKLRKAIRAAAPKAEECISYQLPAFRQGRVLVGFGATGKHCAFYLMSDATVAAHRSDLEGYDTSKGTIRFQPGEPLPATLVRKLVKTRLAENAAADEGKSRPGSAPAGTQKRGAQASGAPRASRAKGAGSSRDAAAVTAFLRDLDHPLKKDIEAVRKIILGASPEIREGIKWNSLSFRTTEYFATLNRRSTESVQLVFHLGAKVKDNSAKGITIADPAGLIKWLARDRCLITLGAGPDIRANRAPLEAIVREWIKHLPAA